jgi:hypothetical protein
MDEVGVDLLVDRHARGRGKERRRQGRAGILPFGASRTLGDRQLRAPLSLDPISSTRPILRTGGCRHPDQPRARRLPQTADRFVIPGRVLPPLRGPQGGARGREDLRAVRGTDEVETAKQLERPNRAVAVRLRDTSATSRSHQERSRPSKPSSGIVDSETIVDAAASNREQPDRERRGGSSTSACG